MNRLAPLLPLLLVGLAACAPKIPVHVDASSRTTLAGYRTYAWMPPPAVERAERRDETVEVFDWRVHTTVASILSDKGYLRTDAGPDLLVLVRTVIAETNAETLGDYFRYRDAGGSQPLFSAYSLGYEEATITVEAYDAATRALLWRGRTAVSMDAAHRDQRAIDSVHALLTAFPRQG
ncbi:MAG: DUF4136 domain-containing protein [Candidatus Binatia bacterium]